MDHSHHMDMSPTTTSGGASASVTPLASSMGGGHGGMGGPNACKISMLWNWNVINSCFLTRSWHIKTRAQFAGTCIGIVLICVGLELIRRLQREYDRKIVRDWARRQTAAHAAESDNFSEEGGKTAKDTGVLVMRKSLLTPLSQRPSFLEQAVRALLYMIQFGIAYIIMLLAMYYNGYILLSIMVGIFIGHYIFGYDNIVIGGKQETGTSCC